MIAFIELFTREGSNFTPRAHRFDPMLLLCFDPFHTINRLIQRTTLPRLLQQIPFTIPQSL
jgi:hypothetical protein